MRPSPLWIYLFWTLLLVGSLTGVYFYVTQGNGVLVRVVKVERGPLVSTLTTNGKVEPVDARELRALTPAAVTNVLVKEGDRVKDGQPMGGVVRTASGREEG